MKSDYIRQSDFELQELTGTTHGTADTQMFFRHGKGKVPWLVLPIEGHVYIPRHGLTPNEIDVRSSDTSESFRILLFF